MIIALACKVELKRCQFWHVVAVELLMCLVVQKLPLVSMLWKKKKKKTNYHSPNKTNKKSKTNQRKNSHIPM